MASPQPLEQSALFARLRGGHDAGITVLTPNARLAQALQAQFDRFQIASGLRSWEAPDILPFAAFVERCHEEAGYADGAEGLPVLLSSAEAQVLWEEAIRSGPWAERMLSVPATAALARDAWQVAYAWRIEGALEASEGTEDTQAFAAWCAHYRRRTQRDHFVDSARLPGVVAARYAGGAGRPPAAIVLYGFDLLTPQQDDFLGACARAGAELARCAAPPVRSEVRRVRFASPRRELEAAARWARDRLERAPPASPPRIGIVVPALGERRAELARIFARVLAPDGLL